MIAAIGLQMVIQRREMVDGVGLVLRNTTSAPGKGFFHLCGSG